jgi:hypothetical protein
MGIHGEESRKSFRNGDRGRGGGGRDCQNCQNRASSENPNLTAETRRRGEELRLGGRISGFGGQIESPQIAFTT